MWFKAHAKGGIKNLKGATELELNFSARRPIKWAAYEHSSPVPKRSGSPAVNAAKAVGDSHRAGRPKHYASFALWNRL
jgi:hypothetical protein